MKVEKKARGRPPKNRVKGMALRDAAIKNLLEDDEIPTQRKSTVKSRLSAGSDADVWDEDFSPSE